jgi:ATPase subunit of ABC transporter with duplicated ATPase domains
MSSQYIFTMHRLSKLHPPDKTVLDNVTLAFYPGAKIGVLGYNGAGKSTLLRIMAGIDQEYRGEAQLAPNATVGMLEQEPQLDESKDVKGNVEEGVAQTKALLDRFNELAANYSEEAACRRRSKPRTPGTSTRSWSTRWTRCACRRRMPT